MNEIYFRIDNNDLYLEQVLEKVDQPILFVCKNKKYDRYICLLVDEELQKYVIAKTNLISLKNMLSGIDEMRTIFKKSSNIYVITTKSCIDEDEINKTQYKNLPPEYLPDKDYCYELLSKSNKKYKDEICKMCSYKENYENLDFSNNNSVNNDIDCFVFNLLNEKYDWTKVFQINDEQNNEVQNHEYSETINDNYEKEYLHYSNRIILAEAA